jgi:hypothetical protein
VGLVAIFYCLRFETSIFVASYDSQGHGGGIRPRLHTGVLLLANSFSLYSPVTDRIEHIVFYSCVRLSWGDHVIATAVLPSNTLLA